MRAGLILGAAVHEGGRPSPALRRRTLRGAALWHAGEVGALVACGGLGRHPPTEAEAMREILLGAGVPEGAIRLEGRSTSTEENLLFALAVLEELGTREVVVVTDLTHAPRAWLIAWSLGLRATTASPSLRGARLRPTLRQALREIPATAVALWRIAHARRGGGRRGP